MTDNQQQPFNVNPGYNSYPVQQIDPGVAALILNPHDVLDSLRHTLKGECISVEYDKDGQRQERWVKPEGVTPLLNDNGINFVNAELIAFVNRVATMSFVDEQEIAKIGKPTCIDFAISMGKDYKKFGLDKNNYHVVNNMVDDLIFFVLKQAYMGGMQKVMRETTQRVETVSQEKKQNKGMLGWLPIGR